MKDKSPVPNCMFYFGDNPSRFYANFQDQGESLFICIHVFSVNYSLPFFFLVKGMVCPPVPRLPMSLPTKRKLPENDSHHLDAFPNLAQFLSTRKWCNGTL